MFSFTPELKESLSAATPGLHLRVIARGNIVIDYSQGETAKFYDLASLTKVIFTVSKIMSLSAKGEIKTSEPVQKYLPWYPHKNVNVCDLLLHRAGYIWWKPLYKEIEGMLLAGEDVSSYLKEMFLKERVKSNKKTTYSDLDFWVLGLILEAVEEKNLSDIWQEFHQEFDFGEMHFNENNKLKFEAADYAPTEDCPWRKKILCGEVHDDNTWAMGGVAAHAGLFGSIDDLSDWALNLRESFFTQEQAKDNFSFKENTNEFFRKRKKTDWAMGLMRASEDNSTIGDLFSRNSVGHLAFTGPSFWFDLDNDVMILLLTNRVHPTRDNKAFNAFRPEIHNQVHDHLVKEKIITNEKKDVRESDGKK